MCTKNTDEVRLDNIVAKVCRFAKPISNKKIEDELLKRLANCQTNLDLFSEASYQIFTKKRGLAIHFSLAMYLKLHEADFNIYLATSFTPGTAVEDSNGLLHNIPTVNVLYYTKYGWNIAIPYMAAAKQRTIETIDIPIDLYRRSQNYPDIWLYNPLGNKPLINMAILEQKFADSKPVLTYTGNYKQLNTFAI